MGTTPEPANQNPECGGADVLDELIEAIRLSEADRRAGRERSGRLLARLYRQGGLSWPAIARATGIKQTTAYELAQPFLTTDEDDEA